MMYKAEYEDDEFEIIYSSAVKRLFKEGMIKKEEAKDLINEVEETLESYREDIKKLIYK